MVWFGWLLTLTVLSWALLKTDAKIQHSFSTKSVFVRIWPYLYLLVRIYTDLLAALRYISIALAYIIIYSIAILRDALLAIAFWQFLP